MPLPERPQPELLAVDGALRLRRYDGAWQTARPWYADPATVHLLDSRAAAGYGDETLRRMYAWQDAHGELYWIEQWEKGGWRAVGDACLAL